MTLTKVKPAGTMVTQLASRIFYKSQAIHLAPAITTPNTPRSDPASQHLTSHSLPPERALKSPHHQWVQVTTTWNVFTFSRSSAQSSPC